MAYALGVDIGGTKIAAGLIDEKGHCAFREQMPSIPGNRESMFEQVVNCIETLLEQSLLTTDQIKGMVLGVPGKVDSENGIAIWQNNLPWENFPLKKRIKDHFLIEHVHIENDVYMAAFGEWFLAGANIDETFVYCTVSTGVSCCTIHRGHFIRGDGFAGEIGFLPVDVNAPYDSLQSLEAVASGSGIMKLAEENLSLEESSVHTTALEITTKQVLQDFEAQKSYAIRTMETTADHLAKGLYSISCLLDPGKLVMGGGIINHHPNFLQAIKLSLEKYLMPEQADLLDRIDTSRLKGDAGLIGTGLLGRRFLK